MPYFEKKKKASSKQDRMAVKVIKENITHTFSGKDDT